MTTLRKTDSLCVALILCVAVSGCAGGGLKNVFAWMNPGNYRSLDTPDVSATDNSLVAESSPSELAAPSSLRSRLARRLPWNKSVDPDPFLVTATTAPDDELLDVRVTDVVRTASAEREISPSPTIRPQQTKPQRKAAAGPEALVDSDADMAAIERIIAEMESAATQQADAARPPVDKPTIIQSGLRGPGPEGVDSNSISNAASVTSDKPSLRQALAANDFDTLLDLDNPPADSAPRVAPTGVFGQMQQDVTVAEIDEAFQQFTQSTLVADQQRTPQTASRIDAASAFDRNLTSAGTTPNSATDFDWQVPKSAADSMFESATVTPAASSASLHESAFAPVFDNQTSPAPQDVASSEFSFSDFRAAQLNSAASATTDTFASSSPFRFAGDSRTVESNVSTPPVIRIPLPVTEAWEHTRNMQDDPFFSESAETLVETRSAAPQEEIAAQTDSPTVTISTDGALTTRNTLLLLGGMIMVILLFAPGRKRA
jgi:hypothetical protein